MLPYIDEPFQFAATRLGASTDQLKVLFSFLLSYPLAGLLKRIPDNKPWAKNAFTISVSIFYLVGLFDLWAGLRTIFISSAGTYLIARYIDGPYMPWIGFVLLMGHLSVNQIKRMNAADPGSVDITGSQMVLVMKLSAFCWNVFDGRQDQAGLRDYQKDRALTELPSIQDYAAFVLFFPSLMVGPAFDFVDYKRWLETSMFELPPGTDPAKAPPTKKKRKIPRSGMPAALKCVQGLGWVLAFLQLDGLYNNSIVLSEEFKHYNFFLRIFHLHMLGFTQRTKYYGVWTLTEGACILAGIGYKGIDSKSGKADWNRLQNTEPLGIELGQNSYAYLGKWNIKTNTWLRNYVYLRVTPKGTKPGFRASMATFVTSAFWHGFYPGYYMTFVLASLIQNVAKNGRRLLRPFFLTPDGSKSTPNKRYYDIFTWLVTQLAFAFTTAPFVLLTFQDSIAVWARVYYYPVIGVTICSLFLLTPGKAWLQRKVKAHQRPTGLVRNESRGRSESGYSIASTRS